MYLSVARMAQSAASEQSADAASEQKPPSQEAPESRRPSSSLEFGSTQTEPDISEPVFVTSTTLKITSPAPAVRVTKKHPTLAIYIYPLSRIELGEVWSAPYLLAQIQANPFPGGWDATIQTFTHYIDYPQEYLQAMINVLRPMKFKDGTALTPEEWTRACKTTTPKMNVTIVCPQCKFLRYLSMRTLYTTSPKHKHLKLTCNDMGYACRQSIEGIIEDLIISTSSAASVKSEGHANETFPLEQMNALAIQTVNNTRSQEYFTWSQRPPQFETLTADAFTQFQYYDPYDATQAAPEHFISGYPLQRFSSPDPTLTEIEEFKRLLGTSEWRDIFRDFSKWSDLNKEAQYNGDEDITVVFTWSTAMKSRFLNTRIYNPVARSELASTTFTQRARKWWLAHRLRMPKLLTTFEQLVEWIKRELVPHSSTSDAVNAWSDLNYHGDPKKYIMDLERLINHFPLRRESILIMATKPLGKDIQHRIQLMNLQHGPTGLTISQLKRAILDFLSLYQYTKNIYRERDRERHPAFTPRPQRQLNQGPYQYRKENAPYNREVKIHAINPVTPSPHQNRDPKAMPTKTLESRPMNQLQNKPYNQNQNNPNLNNFKRNQMNPQQQIKRKIGVGPTPCFVCGSDKHPWIECPKRKRKGKCGCCGAESHLTKMCAQRYHPQMRMTFNQVQMDPNISSRYIEENEPSEESDVEEVDEDTEEIEECVNELHLMQASILQTEKTEIPQEIDEELATEMEQMQISFHSLHMEIDCENQNLDRQFSTDLLFHTMPWQLPSPRDYEGYSLDENMDLKMFHVVHNSQESPWESTEEQPPLPERESAVVPSRLPRPRFKYRFQTDVKEKELAKFDPEWERKYQEQQSVSEQQEIQEEYMITDSTKEEQLPEFNIEDRLEQSPDQKPSYLEVMRSFHAPNQPVLENYLKLMHNDDFPHLFPIQHPNKIGQHLYKISIEGYEVTTLLDLGASHSFVTRTWASGKGLDLTPVRPPRPVGLFSGQKNYIRHVAMVTSLGFREHKRTWRFYVIDSAPFPAILGADAILSWPIFYSPLDHRIFILPELFHSRRNAGDLGGVYKYWHQRDVSQRASCLAHRAFLQKR